jgi:UDP-N-acetylglucosamine 2-epimerase (non-hydrolysing)
MKSKQLKLLLIAGARPNFMKIAPIVRECERRQERFEYRIVHTGQHYDAGMSDVFFEELGIPTPDYHLNVGSGSHAEQTAKVMTSFEPICVDENPDCVIVVGDVNSTLACSIVAKKLLFPLAHIEAGLRSGDRRMPEEINRLVTDAISDYFFVTEPSGATNLESEGQRPDKIFFVGHVMIDNLFHELSKDDDSAHDSEVATLCEKLTDYGIVTLHRPSNVDSIDALGGIVEALNKIAETIELVFPVHPRTRQRISEFGLAISDKIHLFEPLSYREFLWVWKKAKIVLTDSGGLQEETTALGIPCLTLRENTERPITIEMGTNQLVGNKAENIVSAAFEVLGNASAQIDKPPLWDGNASVRILDVLESELRRPI